jgi:hypothetical protein
MKDLRPGEPPRDSDGDGLPDDWEAVHGLAARDGSDHNRKMESGYTAIEEYCHELAAERLAAASGDSPGKAGVRPGTGDQ